MTPDVLPIKVRPYESNGDHDIYMNGFADDVTGDVEAPGGHLYRIDQRIIVTNSQGFSDTYVYASVDDAITAFAWAEERYAEWLEEEA